MKKTVFAEIMLLSLAFAVSGHSVAPQVESMDEKWTANLRVAVGGVPIGLVAGRGHETLSQPRTSVSFLGNQQILATFVIRGSRVRIIETRYFEYKLTASAAGGFA